MVKLNVQVIKKDGHHEHFDERKILLGAFEACMNTHLPRKTCVRTSEQVTNAIKKLVKTKKHVSSDFLFKAIIKELKKHSKDASFMFETHRDIS